MFKHICVPVDNSDYSNRAIDLAVELGRTCGARLTGIHVYAAGLHDYRFKQMEYTLPDEYKDEHELERQRKIHDSLIAMGLQLISDSYLDVIARHAEAAGLAFERKMVDGKHYKVLVEDCLASDYDLVVMGALGMGAVKDSQLGSVTERFVRRVPKDTLVVRNADRLSGSQGAIVERLGEEDAQLQSVEGLGRAVEAHDDRALRTRESVGVADDQRVLRNPADEALGDGAELAVLYGAHAEGAHDDQVIVGGEAVLDEHLVVLAVYHLALEGQPRGLGAPGDHVEVGIGDELQAHGDQRVVDLPLALELVLVLVLIRQRVLHLLEPVVVEPRRVHVDAGQPGAARPTQLDGQVDRPVRIVGVVHRNADVLEHGPSLSQLELDRRRRPGRDRHLFRDRPRLVVHRPAILVGALGPEARVPHRDLVGPWWDVRDPKGPALVRDRDVGAVVDQDPGGHVRVGVAQDVHDPGLREPPGDVDHLALVGQGQVEDRRAAEESVSVVEDRVGVLHVGTVASAQRGDVGDEEALAVVEDHVAAARFAPRDALDQHDATLHAVVGAEHERLGRVRLAADVPVLVDRDQVELRRHADELQGPGHGAAVHHGHDLVRRAGARRGEREHREEDER